MTLRDGMGREVGGGFRMGDTCTPRADSWQCMASVFEFGVESWPIDFSREVFICSVFVFPMITTLYKLAFKNFG